MENENKYDGTIGGILKNSLKKSKAGKTLTGYLDKEFKVKDLLSIIKWAGIGAGIFNASGF
jgi:hypothetical protein